MKKYFFILICVLAMHSSQSQNWQWALRCGGTYNDFGNLAIDNNSNLYMSGYISGSPSVFGNDTLYPKGNTDILFSKLNSNGNFIWSKQIGSSNGAGFEYGDLCYNNVSNCIYLSGVFYDTVNVGINQFISTGGPDIFYAKYDLNGNCLWAKQAGGKGSDDGTILDSDNNGNLYSAGDIFYDSASFDNYTIPKGQFLAKYDGSGNCQWAKNIFNATIINVSCYSNEVLVSGWTEHDTVRMDTMVLLCKPGQVFLAKFDSNGNLIWAKVDGSSVISTSGARYNITGDIYLTCNVSTDSIIFGSFIFPPTSLGGFGVCLVKYDNSGNVLWATKTSQPGGGCRENELNVNADGSCYITGRVDGAVTFGNYTVTAAPGTVDMFLTRYDLNGNCIGVRNTQVDVSSPNPGAGYRLAQESNATCYVAGLFKNTSNFGSQSITSLGDEDIFIAKIDAITGLGEGHKLNGSQLVIYANPNQGKCTIKIPDELKNEKNLTLSIFDDSGKLIQQKNLQMNDDKIKLDLQAEAKGIYNVTLSNKKKSYSGKIVFE